MMLEPRHKPEANFNEVGEIRFNFMTDKEVRKHSVAKITNPTLLDSFERPTPGGLYDPAMGPIDDNAPCKTCGKDAYSCTGHCGHIELVSTAYNPLLFDLLHTLLQKTCFGCFRFRSGQQKVDKCVSLLELISKGRVIEARNLEDSTLSGDDDDSQNRSRQQADSGGSNVSYDGSVYSGSEDKLTHKREPLQSSFQFAEAMSILKNILGHKQKKCEYCGYKGNPKIIKPTFGWFRLDKGSPESIRASIIMSSNLGIAQKESSSEVVTANDSTRTTETESVTSDSPRVRDDPVVKNIGATSDLGQKSVFSGDILPTEVKDVMKLLWENEAPLCSFISEIQREQLEESLSISNYLMFFLDSVAVSPIKFRPPARAGDAVMEHPHTVLLSKVLQSNTALGNAHVQNATRSRIIRRWIDLQQAINVLYNSRTVTGPSQKDGASGICQLLEKKEGIFRQNMMGKRVNFACRSVISPDPYLAVNEIGIPPYFAQRLTYPERVNTHNVAKLRDAVLNGPEVHPGALAYVDTVSTRKLSSGNDPSNRRKREAIARKLSSSRGASQHSRKNSEHEREGKIVLRHIRDGDIVLVNRQPTLHKPSIMAHVVRILKGEKTLRMHYANCSSYNADFDGDEMNVHFPQDEISRAEGYHIVNANEQYIVPTKGDTVRGLIQDHVVSAVLLTMKDRFLTLDEFNQLLYGSGIFALGTAYSSGRSSSKTSVTKGSNEHVGNITLGNVIEGTVHYVLPTVWKPKPLWTGKQVITSLLNHITRGCPPCTVEKETKIPKQYFPIDVYRDLLSKDEDKISENVFLVWKNEHVCGVIDKAQFGQFGLVHTVQELYGSDTAGVLLSALSRLCTMFLQMHGFTCEMGDLCILPDFDLQRKEQLEGDDVGEEVHSEFTKFRHGQIGLKELHLEVEKVISANRESATAFLDMKMKNRLTKKSEKISKGLLREGLLKPFPKNCISLMTISGAKGSTVNFQQISSYLGQQELEGKRVPRMVSGKTLPCFTPWDCAARAGGYITDRFLTGLRQQEYYFHCMAGREGLVDTAVKTSRSGYLQRCLIKNLESLKVGYDYTVRDADCSVVQFCYGEDGVDPHRTSFLKNFRALTLNREALTKKYQVWRDFNVYIDQLPDGLNNKAKSFFKESNINNKTYLLELLKQKYLSSLAPSGEPVGVIAAQSVGEPSTQMTLNTFHLAGRGEMNVTLGIPRLQEILMTASNVIKTPVLACPFLDFKSKDDAYSIVAKVKKITIADMIESIDMHLLPCHKKKFDRIYKLLIKFKCPEFVSSEDCKETLSHSFQMALEDAVENHVTMLSEIRGIKAMTTSSSEGGDVDDNSSDPGPTADVEGKESNDGDDGNKEDSDDEMSEGVSSNVKNRGDDMDYEDGSEDEEEQSSLGKDTTTNEEDDGETMDGEDHENSVKISKDEESMDGEDHENSVKISKDDNGDQGNASEEQMVEAKLLYNDTKRKRKKRITYLAVGSQTFECHFRFTDEPDMLLAQIAQRTAKKVYIKGSGNISECKLVDYDANEKTVIWDDSKKAVINKNNNNVSYWGLKAAGIDFTALWEMSEHLDVNRIYSNNIHAMLETYGVEAARETIYREVKNVFGIYGVEVDFRHLSLIADFMTHDGGYRPMSRHGSIAESMSPLLKMSFETPTKFLVEAALHGMSDHMETPSARICLGLPVKIGTASFDLLQKIEL